MKKLKLLMALCALLLGWSSASADVNIETDLTSQFNSLATTQWTGSSGQVGWAAPKVRTNSGLEVAAWERYNGSCDWTGDIMNSTVTGLAPGTYKIELYGAAAFTFGRGFGSTDFTGDFTKDISETYTENQSITENTGVTLYAETSEGKVSKEIPIWYATNFNTSGIATAVLENVVVGASGQIKIGLSKTSTSTNWHVVQLKGVTATVSGDAVITSLKTTANELLTNPTYANVTGVERTNLQAAYDATPAAETQEAYLAVISALNTAISAFEGCDVAAYDKFVAEKTKATALGMDVSGYTATNAADAVAKTQTIMVDEYTYVTTNYSYGVELGTWTTTGPTGSLSEQHYKGPGYPYLEQSGAAWGSGSWEIKYEQDLTLPAGNYVFKVAGRQADSDGVTLSLAVKNGETTLGTVSDFPRGDTGKGIDTSGATNFGDGDFVNNGSGRGWQWRYVKFTLAEPTTVNVAVEAVATIEHMWVSFCDATVQTDDGDNVELMEALVALNSAKAVATLERRTANVGTGIFQISNTEESYLWGAYDDAKGQADGYEFTASSTASEVNGITSALTNAQTAYSNFLANPTLNVPDPSKRYNVSIVEAEKAWDGNAITFIEGGRADQGNYGVKYLAPANVNLNQALKFTPVLDEPNTYKVSAIRVENGSEQYLTTGSTYEGGNNDQIRTTDDASKAMWIKIEPTTTDNQFQLRNMSANKIIANNDNDDMYTAGSANFTIAEASQATVDMTIDENLKYITRIFPFIPTTWPNGVVAYSCEEAEGNVLTLVEVAEPVANVPYILYAENGSTGSVSGWGTAAQTSYTAGWLTGVYEETEAPVNSYVLQNLAGGFGFYKVAAEKEPTVGAYRCYLTDGENLGRAAYFFPGSVTGVNQIDNGQLTIDNSQPVKRIVNGKLVIEKNGKKFNATGAQMK